MQPEHGFVNTQGTTQENGSQCALGSYWAQQTL